MTSRGNWLDESTQCFWEDKCTLQRGQTFKSQLLDLVKHNPPAIFKQSEKLLSSINLQNVLCALCEGRMNRAGVNLERRSFWRRYSSSPEDINTSDKELHKRCPHHLEEPGCSKKLKDAFPFEMNPRIDQKFGFVLYKLFQRLEALLANVCSVFRELHGN